ncbi:hypothetical protein LOK49_LG05G01554 [Camellia lanceoleosa]|uniref:Uncharacterized protein n=1 Tax=Camellia lanceoleosa TaxID=1840588 RepID=A0ACC0HJK4_9ERIC|nr:hypothetical protein LOK49_LG05G01554 [Camellia lanceoleosa]
MEKIKERGKDSAGGDGHASAVIDATGVLAGELFKRGIVIEYYIHAFDSEHARSIRELLQTFVVLGENSHAKVGELAASAELQAREVNTTKADENQGVVV